MTLEIYTDYLQSCRYSFIIYCTSTINNESLVKVVGFPCSLQLNKISLNCNKCRDLIDLKQ